MNKFEAAADVDSAIARACYGFLAQVEAMVVIYGMSVILLDQDQATSRVVFFWEAPDNADNFSGSKTGSDLDEEINYPTFVALRGLEGTFGAVLIRGRSPGIHGPVEPDLVRKPTEHLAALLENILLQHRLDQNALEGMVLDRIGEFAGSNAPIEQLYELFADELLNLVEYQKLTVLVANLPADLLYCDYWVGDGMLLIPANMPRPISGTDYEQLVSTGNSCVIEDLQDSIEPYWPASSSDPSMRSAVIVPVVYGGSTVGMVALENRLPKAFGPRDENLLLRAANMLGPAMGNPARYRDQLDGTQEAAATTEISRILSSNRLTEDVFYRVASVASGLVEFDCMALAWLDSYGSDILELQAFPTGSVFRAMTENERSECIQTRLQFGQDYIGTLSVWRLVGNGAGFNRRDEEILERIGAQVFFAVQYDRLYRLSRHQAVQLGCGTQFPQSVGQVWDLGERSHYVAQEGTAPGLPPEVAPAYFDAELGELTRIPHLAQTSDAVNRQLSCFSSRYMNLLAVFQI